MSGDLVPEGRKKGGGGSESANTLRSTQIAEVVLLISEGEAKGLVNGLKSVYLDKVPIQNQDGSFNFEDVSFAYVPGTQAQAPLPGITSLQNEISVGVTVVQATPVVRSITNSLVDHVRVTIQAPALTDLDLGSGTLNGSWFEYAIDIQSAGGGYVQRHFERVEGKATSLYAKAVRLELTGTGPWDVRVRRVSIDPPSNIQSAFSWSSYTEITSIKLRYPNVAVGVLRVNAKSFQQVPVVALDWLGQLVDVPSNYNPITRVYTGTWSGTFNKAWTSCPPWVLHDLVTHTRYGAGDWVSALVSNKWALYAIGQYCDAMVSDGRGGTEPRFSCNVNLEVRAEALNVIRDLAAVFRGMVFWASGMVDYAQDAPGDPVHTFTPANVVEGRFSYSDVSEKKQHSVFICWWNDLAQFGKLVPELYVDETLVARYGIKTFEMQPLGLTSRGQAARACRWARHSEQEEGELVTFEVGADGVAVQLGKTFRIADPNEAGERLGGRIKTATTTQVTLDAPVTLASGETYTLTVLQPDPADPTRLVAQTRTVTTAAGTVSVINVGTAFSAAPAAQSVWLLESNAVGATLWRCMGIEEVAGKNRFKITGIAHNPGKYAAIESGLVLDQRKVSRLQLVPPKPTGLAMAENVYRSGQLMRSRATLSWLAPLQGLLYQVAWRYNGGAWTPEPDTSANALDVDGLGAGTLDVRVRSLNSLGNSSLATTATFTLTGAGALVGADDLVLIARGNCTLLGNQATKTGGTGAWDSDVYSRDSYVGGAFVSAVPGQANRSLMFGLNSDPLTDTDYPSLDFAIYCDGTAALLAYESGVAASLGTYAAGDVLAVVYDGARVRYLKNGAVLRTITVAAGLTLFMDSSFNSPGSVLKNIRFGPLTAGDWSSIYGPNKPSDNATTDLALVARGNCTLVGNSATKNGGAGAWDSDVYSRDSYVGGAFVSAVPGQANLDLLFGLNSDPTTDQNFNSIDFSFYCEGAGNLLVYESGAGTNVGTYAAGDVLAVVYDGARVRYLKNGAVLRTLTVSPGLALFMDSSFYGPGAVLRNVRFGPMTAGDWASIYGPAKPADNATADLVLIGRGCAVTGNSSIKTGGASAWDSDTYSKDSFTGGAFASIVAAQANRALMFGLNSDPTTDSNYTGLDFSFSLGSAGALEIYESNTNRGSFGTYATGDVLAVVYDGYNVRYMRNGAVLRSVVAGVGLNLFFDSSFFTPAARMDNIRFGPLSAVAGIDFQQIVPGAVTAAIVQSAQIVFVGWPNTTAIWTPYPLSSPAHEESFVSKGAGYVTADMVCQMGFNDLQASVKLVRFSADISLVDNAGTLIAGSVGAAEFILPVAPMSSTTGVVEVTGSTRLTASGLTPGATYKLRITIGSIIAGDANGSVVAPGPSADLTASARMCFVLNPV